MLSLGENMKLQKKKHQVEIYHETMKPWNQTMNIHYNCK